MGKMPGYMLWRFNYSWQRYGGYPDRQAVAEKKITRFDDPAGQIFLAKVEFSSKKM
jgi:hypothetical protein